MKPAKHISKIGFGLNFRRMINDVANRNAADQSICASMFLESSELSKKVSSKMVKPADMIKPTDEAFRLFSATETYNDS